VAASGLWPGPDFLACVIQDFEPGFYPWSAQHLLARSTYERPSETVALFNSGLLRDYFHAEGLAFEREFVFEPRLLAALRAILPTGSGGQEHRIVVYGRPWTPRNGFPLIIEALRRWRATYARAAEWAVVSAGQPHSDIVLGAGTVLRSVGKLDLDAYGQLLTTSAVGVALMVSPHPSYPPLEMAQLGMRVVTNRFGAKDLATWHPNITSAPDLSPEGVARAIAYAYDAYEADPSSSGGQETLRPDDLSDGPAFQFAAEVAALLVASAAGGAPRVPHGRDDPRRALEPLRNAAESPAPGDTVAGRGFRPPSAPRCAATRAQRERTPDRSPRVAAPRLRPG